MKKTLLAAMLLIAFACYTYAQDPNRGIHQGETFELNAPLFNGEDHTYTASNHIKLLPGFNANPADNMSALLNLGLDEYGIYPPDNGLVNASGNVVGSLGGTVNIGAMGGLNYTIPIDLPTGINGMQPSISISYNNQGGNGLMGWGWDLCATSCITRTGQSIYHDGRMTAADLSLNDRFLLDGQRLVLVSGYYGMISSEYKTENDCMSKILMLEDSNGGGAQNGSVRTCFKIWDRSGNILEYRDKLYSPDSNKEIIWMLSSITDRYGNSIRYHYDTNNGTGEIKLTDIEYTVNETNNEQAQFRVTFNYLSKREDYELYYIGGCQLYHQDLLKSISIKALDNGLEKPLSLYVFDYIKELSGIRNRLYHILSSVSYMVFDENGQVERITPTTITWDETSPNAADLFQVINSDILSKFPFTGDFNGDGFTDLALVPYKSEGQDNSGNPVDICFFLNDRNRGFTHAASMDITSLSKTLDWIYVVDIDGDGLDDIVPFFYDTIPNKEEDSTVVRVYHNEQTYFTQIGEKYVKNKVVVITGDFDGNSTSDVVLLEKKDFEFLNWGWNWINPPSTIVPYLQNIFWMGYRNSVFQINKLNDRALNKSIGPLYDAVAFDNNGDGISEVLLVGLNDDDYDNYASKLVKFEFNNSNTGLSIIEAYENRLYPYYDINRRQWCHVFPGDYNGDGKTDLLFYTYSTWKISFSEGDRMGSPYEIANEYNSNFGLPSLNYFRNIYPPSLSLMNEIPSENKMLFSVADFDGDGCSDVCYSRENFNNRMILASRIGMNANRSLTFRKKKALEISFNFRSQFTHVGNFMGRDNCSFLESLQPSENDRSGNAYIILPASVNQYNSVSSITDGLGNRTSFTYDCLMPSPESEENPFYSFTYQSPDQYGIQPLPLAVRAVKTCETEGINGSSTINKYSYSYAYYHRYGHGFMGFRKTINDTYRNSLESGWKTRNTVYNNRATMGSYAMMLPQHEYNYVVENNLPKLVGETIYDFTNVILSNNNTNLVFCPALLNKTEKTYSLDDAHAKIKTVCTEYEYDYSQNLTYLDTYNCTNTTQTVTGYENGQSHTELVAQTTTHLSSYPSYWILNRPDWETVVLTRNGETTATHTEYAYEGNTIYGPYLVTIIPNDGSQPTDPLTTVTHIGYDAFGVKSDVIVEAPYGTHNEQQREVHYYYGSQYHHRLLTKEVRGPEHGGFITLYQYDFHDRLCSATDCNGNVVRTENNLSGTVQSVFNIDNTEQRTLTLWADNSPYKPEGASYYIWSKKTGGVTTMTFYHKTGLELRSVTFAFDGTPVLADKRYNENGLLEMESAPYRQGEPEENLVWTSYTYDDKERMLSIDYPDGTMKTMAYHGLQTTTTITPTEGDSQTTTTILNAMGWPKENIDAVGTQTPTSVHYEYYPDGNLKWTRINDDETTTIRLAYDHAGNRTLLHDPDYCTETADLTSIYNAFGEEVSTTTPRGLTTTYLYDQYGRMTQRTEEEPLAGGGTETKTTVWDFYQDATEHHRGLLHSITYPGQTITYSYDNYQRVIAETSLFAPGETYTTFYGYDPASRKSSVRYPSGFTVNYHYNRIGYFQEITDNKGNTLYRTDKVNPMGQIERFALGNNMICRKEYHPDKHTLTHILTSNGNNMLQDLSYDYDGFCNLAWRTDNTRNLTESFTYDHLNRLTEIWLGNIKTGWFDYDPYGRMIGKTADNRPVFASAVYNITAKPHAIDAAKVWSDVFPNDDMDITYTAFDKVKTLAEGNNTLAYTYGYDRQRIFMEEHANGTIRTKRYVGGCEFVTLTENNTTTEKTLTYLSSPIGIFAVVETVGMDENLHYILKDHLGSWATITDCQGNIEQELSFDAWGNRRNPETWHSSSQLPEPMFDRGFTGHEHLYAFGLINMNGRMYDPLMSSFLSVDAYVQSPDNSQNFNRYAYCLNNPLKYTDPTGWRMVGGCVGNSTQGPSGWGKNLYPVYEPRDLKNLQLSEDFVLTLWRHGNTFGGNNKEDGGGGAMLEGFEFQTQDAWKPKPEDCKYFCYSMIEHYFFGENGRSAEQIKQEWNDLAKGQIPDGNTEISLYRDICNSMGYHCYDMGDENGKTNDQEILNAMQMGDPVLLLSYYINYEGIISRAHARVICGIDYLSTGTAELKIADPMLTRFEHRTFSELARDEYNNQTYNRFLWFRYSK